MSFAVLFAGQGTQHAAMLPWLETESVCVCILHAMQRSTGVNWRAALQDIQQRSNNTFAQVLIAGTSLAAWAAVSHQLELLADASDTSMDLAPTVVAGYSVGELAAFACAGVFDANTAITLAVQRAALMDAAVAGKNTGLLSVSGMSSVAVLSSCPGLECAIQLAADQAIYAGQTLALDACCAALSSQGAHCKQLEVRVASHSHWMTPASHDFAQVLAHKSLVTPRCAIALNATGAVTRKVHELQQGLHQQIAGTVQWSACMDAIAEKHVRCVIEIGAGTALSKLWNQRHPDIPARSVDEFRDAAGAARWILRKQRGD